MTLPQPEPRTRDLPEKHLHTKCGHMLPGSGLMSYRCELALGHTEVPRSDPEPHYAAEVTRTVQAWQEWKWRQDNPQAVDGPVEEQPYVATAKGGEAPVEVPAHPALEDTAYDPDVHTDTFAEPDDAPGLTEAAQGERLRTREGDQRLPDGDETLADDQSLLISDIEARRQIGIQRYGQGHRPFNGRDTLKDWYEEQLDGLVYARSIKRMADATREDLIREVGGALKRISDSGDPQQTRISSMSEQIVDRIMGWVSAQIIGNGTGVSDEVLEALIVDGIHEAIHAEKTWGEAASHIVAKVKREREQ